jgi:transcriptional regulator with XRE-family HTH domain
MPDKESDFRVAVGKRLRILREHLKMDQEEIGKIIGQAGSGVSMIEAGHRGLDPERATRLRQATGVTLDWLYANQGGALPKNLLPLTLPRAVVNEAPSKRRKRSQGGT